MVRLARPSPIPYPLFPSYGYTITFPPLGWSVCPVR